MSTWMIMMTLLRAFDMHTRRRRLAGIVMICSCYQTSHLCEYFSTFCGQLCWTFHSYRSRYKFLRFICHSEYSTGR